MMLEKTPRIVCFPEPGSMCTASHSSHARSCGFEFTFLLSTGAELEVARGAWANHFARDEALCQRMACSIPRSAYPHWFVVACAVLAAAAVLWVLLKLLKAALWILFFGLLIAVALAAAWLFLQVGRALV
jgi:hypothetical protein